MLSLDIPEFVLFILRRLKAAGNQAVIVGGAVRDAYLGRPVTDWDVATSAQPDELRSLFSEIDQFSLKHGTVTLVNSGRYFEVSTFRGKGGRLESDLSHRDFTINAMAYDPEKKEMLDPFCGMADLRRKIVRAVGNPSARFREDPLRLLRAIRFSVELQLRIHPRTRDTISDMASMIKMAAPERIREELVKVLASPQPSRGFNQMVRTGLLKSIIPELLEGYLKRQNAYHRYTIFKHVMETVDRAEPDPELRLAALLHDVAKPRRRERHGKTWRFYGHEKESAELAEKIMIRLRFSRDVVRKVSKLVRHHMIGYDSQWTDAAVRRLIRRVGTEDVMDLLRLYKADIYAHGVNGENLQLADQLEKRVRAQLRSSPPFRRVDLAIGGHEVMKVLNIHSGPEVGKVLADLLDRVTDQPKLNQRETLLRELEQMKTG